MTTALLTSLMLAPGAGVRVGVLGEGKLRFAVGRKVTTAISATLAPNAAGLLADEAGRPVTPAIRVLSGALKIAMNGTVSVSGTKVGRLVLERSGADGAEFGFPGEEGLGVLQVSAASSTKSAPSTPSNSSKTTAAPPTTAAVATVRFRANNELTGDRILLGSVAEITGEPTAVARLNTIDLGALPSLGTRRTLSPWSVKAALKSQGVADKEFTLSFPPDVTVARKGQTIDANDLVAKAMEKAREIVPTGELTLSAGPAPMLVPCGETSFDCLFERRSTQVTVTVKVSVDGKPAAQSVLRFAATGPGIKSGDAVRITLARNGAVVQTDGKAKTAGFALPSVWTT
ncbi:hypothetical protein EON82_24595, partial [bacterium]